MRVVRRDLRLEETLVAKWAAVSDALDERARRLWAAAESRAIGYGGDAVVSAATGLAPQTIRNGRREIENGTGATGRIRRPGAGRPPIHATQPGIKDALEKLVATDKGRSDASSAMDVQESGEPGVRTYKAGLDH